MLLDLPDLIIDEPTAFHVATQLSHVLGGIGSPSGVRKPSRRSAAFFSLGLKPRMPSRTNAAFIRLTIRALLSNEALALAVGPLGIFVLDRRDRHHLAVITLAAQPAEKGAFEQLGIETVSLGAPVLARYGYTRCVNDVGFDAACLEPARQPETVPASLEGDCNAFDPASCFLASSRHRCSSFSNALSSTASFFNGWRSTPGTIPATSQLDWLISMTAISVTSSSRGQGIGSDRSTSAWGAPSVHISDDG